VSSFACPIVAPAISKWTGNGEEVDLGGLVDQSSYTVELDLQLHSLRLNSAWRRALRSNSKWHENVDTAMSAPSDDDIKYISANVRSTWRMYVEGQSDKCTDGA